MMLVTLLIYGAGIIVILGAVVFLTLAGDQWD
jgi:hypothetical protein